MNTVELFQNATASGRRAHGRGPGSTARREVIGGLTTFLSMAYIVVVNSVFLPAVIPLHCS